MALVNEQAGSGMARYRIYWSDKHGNSGEQEIDAENQYQAIWNFAVHVWLWRGQVHPRTITGIERML